MRTNIYGLVSVIYIYIYIYIIQQMAMLGHMYQYDWAYHMKSIFSDEWDNTTFYQK